MSHNLKFMSHNLRYNIKLWVRYGDDPAQLRALFDVLPDILLYAKDNQSRFTMANVAELNMV